MSHAFQQKKALQRKLNRSSKEEYAGVEIGERFAINSRADAARNSSARQAK